jgi:zinc transport system substrate-binding protein
MNGLDKLDPRTPNLDRRTPRLGRRAPLLLAPVLLAATLSGCSSDAGDGKLKVATGFYPLQYAAQRVAGDLADVENLTQPGQEPHDTSLTVRETAEVADADLVVYERGLQPSVDEAVTSTASGATLDAAAVVHLEPFAAGDDMEHEGALDPHFWHDPARMADLGDAIADELAALDPDHADTFHANADALRADLESLDKEYAGGLRDCARDTIVVSHDAFGYLAKYGLTMAPIAGLSPGAEPTPADLARLHVLIERDGITTVFSERLASPKLSETLASDLGITTAVLDPIEGLTDETADQDYLSLMRSNLGALEKANGC